MAATGTGGIISFDTSGNTVHTFLSSGTFRPAENINADVLLVAGGGGGGSLHATYGGSGGGGGGGYVASAGRALTVQNYAVVIGDGGAATTNGSDTTFDGLTAIGGGAGGDYGESAGVNGGCGGGGPGKTSGSCPGGTGSQGYNGGAGYISATVPCGGGGGGGGSAGAAGASNDAGDGGNGYSSAIRGSTILYGAGGGGARWNSSGSNGVGGNTGGGNGNDLGVGYAGRLNYGAGGGAGRTGGNGGKGIFIVRYPTTSTWLDPWQYRKTVKLKRASGAVYSYPMKLLVGESSGAVGEQVDLNAKCKTDFSDLRFTGADGVTLLNYWIESISGVSPNQLATIWINFPFIDTADTTFYMYYGNAAASAVSSGVNTFDKFENFEWGADEDNLSTSGGSLTWTLDGGEAKIDTAKAYGGTRSGRISNGSTTVKFPLNVTSDVLGKRIQFRFYKENACANGPDVSQGDGVNRWIVYANTSEDLRYYNESDTDSTENVTADAWQLLEIFNIDHVAQTFSFRLNGGTIYNATGMYTNSSFSGYLRFNGGASGIWWIDNILIGNFSSTEPTWESFGSETPDPTTAPPTTLAPTTLQPTTLAPTTLLPTTLAPTTLLATTLAGTTLAPTTLLATTLAPTTLVPLRGSLIGGKLVNKSILSRRLVQ